MTIPVLDAVTVTPENIAELQSWSEHTLKVGDQVKIPQQHSVDFRPFQQLRQWLGEG